jgi:Gpi18-like mannosyltransferase
MLIDGIFFFILFGLFLIGLNNDMDIEIKYGIGILMQIGLAVLILLTFYEIGIRIKEKIK